MISLKKIVSQLAKEHKRGYNMANNPDSVKSRSDSMRKVRKPGAINPLTGEEDPDSGNEMQANGAEIAQKMDFDRDKQRSINDKEPLAMMDVVYDIWKGYGDEDDKQLKQIEKEREADIERKKQTTRGR